MASGGGLGPSSSISYWGDDLNDRESIEAIDAAFSLAEAHAAKRSRLLDHNINRGSDGRRLPDWESRWTSRAPDPASLSSPSSAPLRRHNGSDVIKGDGRFTHSGAGGGKSSTENLVPSPLPFTVKARLPSMNFGGHIVYSRTTLEVEEATRELWKMLEDKKHEMDKIPLGFDIEWKPNFKRGEAPNKAAVMQICAGIDHCFVMHIFHSGIPPILQSLLEDSATTKVGVSIGNDLSKIKKDYNVDIKNFEDLSDLANVKLGGVAKSWGLSSLVETLTCKQLDKPKRIRMSNWEVLKSSQMLHPTENMPRR